MGIPIRCKYAWRVLWNIGDLVLSIIGIWILWTTSRTGSCAFEEKLFVNGLAAFSTFYLALRMVGGGIIAVRQKADELDKTNLRNAFLRGLFLQELPYAQYGRDKKAVAEKRKESETASARAGAVGHQPVVATGSLYEKITKLELLYLVCSLGQVAIMFIKIHVRYYCTNTKFKWEYEMTLLVTVGIFSWLSTSANAASLLLSWEKPGDKNNIALWELQKDLKSRILLCGYFALSSAAHATMFVVLSSTLYYVFYPVVGCMLGLLALLMAIPYVSLCRVLYRALISATLSFPWKQTHPYRTGNWRRWQWIPSSAAALVTTVVMIVFGSLYSRPSPPSYFINTENDNNLLSLESRPSPPSYFFNTDNDNKGERQIIGTICICLGVANAICFFIIQVWQIRKLLNQTPTLGV